MPSTKPAALSKADLDFMNGKQLTTEGVSKEIRLFSYLIDPFAEGTKFQPINKTSDSEPDTTGVEANDHGGDGDQSQADPTAALVGATGLTNTDTAVSSQTCSISSSLPDPRLLYPLRSWRSCHLQHQHYVIFRFLT